MFFDWHFQSNLYSFSSIHDFTKNHPPLENELEMKMAAQPGHRLYTSSESKIGLLCMVFIFISPKTSNIFFLYCQKALKKKLEPFDSNHFSEDVHEYVRTSSDA